MEGTQRQLRARLANRLRGDDTHRFAEVYHLHRREIAAVTHPAQPALRLAREHGTNANRLDARLLDIARRLLVDQIARFGEHTLASRLIALVRILDLLGGDVADDALGERLDDILALFQRGDIETLNCPTVFLRNGHVLSDVDEPSR